MTQSLDLDSAKLLRALAGPCVGGSGDTIASLAARIQCWENVVEAARRHRIAPMLYTWLRENKAHVPAKVFDLVKQEFERNALHCLFNAEELLCILHDFDQAGIRAMPFKGVVLGASAYGDMTARNAGDLDLLIHYNDLNRASVMLKERGYDLKSKVLQDGTPAIQDCFEFHFERASDGMVVELRWRLELVQPRYRYRLGLEWVWPRRSTVPIAGANVPNLDPVTSLLVLCMHGSKHVWSRLIWVLDVAKLLEREPDLDWNFAQSEAKRVGLWRCLALGVLLARLVAGAQVPSGVLHRFERNRPMRNLAVFFHENLLDRPGESPDGWIPYNVKILGLRDRARVVFSLAFFRPNARDRAFLKLPRVLDGLYFVVRPLRMLLDRTGR